MFKRIFFLILVTTILILSIMPIINAEDEYIVIPDEDREIVYRIYPDESMNPLHYYVIYGYDSISLPYITAPNPLATTYFGDLEEISDGVYEYSLFSTINNVRQSVLQLNVINSGTQYSLKYVVRNLGNNTEYSYFITPLTSTSNDICIYADGSGILYAYYYNTHNLESVNITGYSGQQLKCYFYGDIYLDGQGPSDITIGDLNSAYNRGLTDGEEIGYQKGLEDSVLPNDQLQNAYDQGKEEGYNDGYNKGYEDGAMLDNEAVYQAGINKGQEQAQLIPSAINGFFEAILKFFQPFLSIGIGSITLYSLLGVMVIVVICILIIRFTRG